MKEMRQELHQAEEDQKASPAPSPWMDSEILARMQHLMGSNEEMGQLAEGCKKLPQTWKGGSEKDLHAIRSNLPSNSSLVQGGSNISKQFAHFPKFQSMTSIGAYARAAVLSWTPDARAACRPMRSVTVQHANLAFMVHIVALASMTPSGAAWKEEIACHCLPTSATRSRLGVTFLRGCSHVFQNCLT